MDKVFGLINSSIHHPHVIIMNKSKQTAWYSPWYYQHKIT
jgi:hypothetical protein